MFGTLKMAQSQGGAVPQNVNFAISAAVAVNFLNVKGVNPKIDLSPTEKLEPEVLAEAAKRFTVQVYCEWGFDSSSASTDRRSGDRSIDGQDGPQQSPARVCVTTPRVIR